MKQRDLTDGLSSSCCGYQLTAMDCGKSSGPKADFTRSVTSSKSQLLKPFPVSKGSALGTHNRLVLSPKMFLLGLAQVCHLCFPNLERQETA